MKYLFCLTLVVFTFSIQAKELMGNVANKNWESAKNASSRLQFIVESTKIGIFSSDVDGYVKEFSYKADYDEVNGILKNMQITFAVTSMDTDNNDRNQKLHNMCLSFKKYPQIVINIPGPISIKKMQTYQQKGNVLIRGKKKEFSVSFKISEVNKSFLLSGNTVWSLKEMEIPDPSIAIATLSDEIRINFKLKVDKKL